jgi:hypothetical protein
MMMLLFMHMMGMFYNHFGMTMCNHFGMTMNIKRAHAYSVYSVSGPKGMSIGIHYKINSRVL